MSAFVASGALKISFINFETLTIDSLFKMVIILDYFRIFDTFTTLIKEETFVKSRFFGQIANIKFRGKYHSRKFNKMNNSNSSIEMCLICLKFEVIFFILYINVQNQ